MGPSARLFGRIVAHRELRRVVKYCIVGASNTLIDFAVYVALVTIGVWYPLAKVAAFAVAIANGYTFNRTWTFRAGGHRKVMLAKYAVVQTSCLLLNLGLLVMFVEVAGLHEVVAQAIALPFIALVGFLAQRLWTFRSAEPLPAGGSAAR